MNHCIAVVSLILNFKAGYVTHVLLSLVLFVNKVLPLVTYDNGSEKGTGVNENEHICDPLL